MENWVRGGRIARWGLEGRDVRGPGIRQMGLDYRARMKVDREKGMVTDLRSAEDVKQSLVAHDEVLAGRFLLGQVTGMESAWRSVAVGRVATREQTNGPEGCET